MQNLQKLVFWNCPWSGRLCTSGSWATVLIPKRYIRIRDVKDSSVLSSLRSTLYRLLLSRFSTLWCTNNALCGLLLLHSGWLAERRERWPNAWSMSTSGGKFRLAVTEIASTSGFLTSVDDDKEVAWARHISLRRWWTNARFVSTSSWIGPPTDPKVALPIDLNRYNHLPPAWR